MLLDYFQRGGLVMWPILATSIVAFAVVLDRIGWLLRSRGDAARLRREVIGLLERGALPEARARLAGSRQPVAAVLAAGVSAWDEPQAELERQLEQAAAEELERAELRLPLLATTVAILPMLGFLGTIFGLILAFSAWAKAGAGVSIEELAGGISQAMITTAAGLATSIPYVVAYNWLANRVAGTARALNAAASEVAGRRLALRESARSEAGLRWPTRARDPAAVEEQAA